MGNNSVDDVDISFDTDTSLLRNKNRKINNLSIQSIQLEETNNNLPSHYEQETEHSLDPEEEALMKHTQKLRDLQVGLLKNIETQTNLLNKQWAEYTKREKKNENMNQTLQKMSSTNRNFFEDNVNYKNLPYFDNQLKTENINFENDANKATLLKAHHHQQQEFQDQMDFTLSEERVSTGLDNENYHSAPTLQNNQLHPNWTHHKKEQKKMTFI